MIHISLGTLVKKKAEKEMKVKKTNITTFFYPCDKKNNNCLLKKDCTKKQIREYRDKRILIVP